MGTKGKKSAGTINKNPADTERKENFALVFYKKESKKGVIQTKDIPKKHRKVGATCSCPNPIDFYDDNDNDDPPPIKIAKTLHEAKIVEFGNNIQCLYDLPMRLDGVIDFGAPANLPKATRKKHTEITALKAQTVSQIDQSIVKVVGLFPDVPAGPSKTIEIEVHEVEVTTGSLRQIDTEDLDLHNISFSSEKTVELNHDSTLISKEAYKSKDNLSDSYQSDSHPILSSKEADESKNETDDSNDTNGGPNLISKGVEQRTSGSHSSRDHSDHDNLNTTTGRENNVMQVLSSASPENMQFLKSLAISDNLEFLGRICAAFTNTDENQEVPPQVTAQGQHHHTIQHKKINTAFAAFECSQNSDNTKFPLVKTMKVYMSKAEFCCIPNLEVSNKDTNLPVVCTKSVRDVVNDLVDKLIPRDVKVRSSSKNLPTEIIKAIEAYINLRMPKGQKVKLPFVKECVTERCRQAKPRDRAAEKAKRDEAKKNGTFKPRNKKKNKENNPPSSPPPSS